MARPKALTTAPCFIVSDLDASIAFYRKLGFDEPGVWGEPPCFAMLNRDGLDIMLSLAQQPGDIIEIEVLDPDGHRICLGQEVEPE